MGKRILIAYDGTEPSRRALARAVDVAGYASSVTIVNVASPLDPPGRNGSGDPDPLGGTKALLEEARAELALRHVRADVVARVGDPAEALVDAARRLEADLVILGTHGRASDSRRNGSVSQALVLDAPCDVMVVR